MIRLCGERDFDAILATINDGSEAYRGVIPEDRWSDPYMSPQKLRHEMEQGVVFHALVTDDVPVGVMGVQKVMDVTLIRHAYVRTSVRRQGIGGKLLAHLQALTTGPMLIGTWSDAVWAINFYERNGFRLVACSEKDHLLRRYWTIPERQVKTSVVLADFRWRSTQISQVN